METFKSELLTLLIGFFLVSFFWTVYNMMKRMLTGISDKADGSRRNVLPVRYHDAPVPESKPAGLIQYWFRELTSNYRFYTNICRQIPLRHTLLSAAADILLMIALSACMALFCGHSDGGTDLYMTTFMRLMYILSALILFARCLNSSRAVYLPCCVLILTGVALAVLLYLSPMAKVPVNYIGHPEQSVLFHVLALFLSFAVFPLIRMVCRADRRTGSLFVLNALLLAIYAILMVFGEEIHGVKNWLRIGSFQFQVSEVSKVLTLAILGLTLTNEQMSDARRFAWAVLTMGISGIFLLLASEFGTLMVLCAVFAGLCLIYQRDLRRLIALVAFVVILMSAFLFTSKCCYDLTNPPETTVSSAEDSIQETPEEDAEEPSPLIIRLGKYYKKFRDRFLVFLMPDQVNLMREGYQWMKSREALIIADWGSSPFDISIPVARSDFIFSYLIVRLGLAYGFFVLLLLLVMLCAGFVRSLQNPYTGEAAVSLSFLLSIVIQAVIASASSTGLFAIVGIPFAFLAYGGSAMMMNYIMLVFLIYATRSKPLSTGRPYRPRVISRREE